MCCAYYLLRPQPSVVQTGKCYCPTATIRSLPSGSPHEHADEKKKFLLNRQTKHIGIHHCNAKVNLTCMTGLYKPVILRTDQQQRP